MNWVKIMHLKNEEEFAINITNKSFEEVIDDIRKSLDCRYTLEIENELSIYVININEIAYMEVRCTNEEN